MTQSTSRAEPLRANARGESTRARLLGAALQAFAKQGFHGTSTRDLADAAGMSPAAVYVHYPTKEELLFQLSLAGHSGVRDVVLHAMQTSDLPPEQLREAARQFAAWHARFHTQARVVQYEMAAMTPEHVEEIAKMRRAIQARLRDVIVAGVERGDFHVPDVSMAALAVLSMGIDVARWYREDGAWTPEQIGAQYGELALRLVGYPG